MCDGHYTLWHLETGNAIGYKDGILEAARMVVSEVETNNDADSLALDFIGCGECRCHEADDGQV